LVHLRDHAGAPIVPRHDERIWDGVVIDPVYFLGFRFAKGSRAALFDEVIARSRGPFGYVVTPNVDFATRAAADADVARLYDGAALQLCDSRILALLAKTKGVALDCYPGSDLVADLLAAPGARRIAAVGPSTDDWVRLTARYPAARLSLIPSTIMAPGDAAWDVAVHAARDAAWDVLLLCLGSPKQERFAAGLAKAGRDRGIALCVGASVDFLTGRQRRAPRWMQAWRLEWLHRLLGNPRRLWRRYLLDGPRIVRLLLKDASPSRLDP
jgi:exopolysaccharide biosynthesis WecB/TagA/CpsF family protein